MAYGDLKNCERCGRVIKFVRSPKGVPVPCESFSVRVVPHKSGKLFYLGDGGTVWGIKTAENDPAAVTAWESHYAVCPKPAEKPRRKRKKSPEEIAKAREAAAMERDLTVQSLLVKRQKEWEALLSSSCD